MILQNSELTRFLLIFTLQSTIAIFFFYLALRILKRNLNRITLNLSLFYVLTGSGLILNVIYIAISGTFLGYIIYFLTAYFSALGPIFIVIFIQNLLDLNSNFPTKKQIIIIFSYAIILFLLLIFPGGIDIYEGTPIYSWLLLVLLYIFFTFYLSIPTIFYSIKLYKRFLDKNLKKKLRFFFIGIFAMFFGLYGLILYNTWQGSIFRSIWIFILMVIIIPSGYLIYYGIGRGI